MTLEMNETLQHKSDQTPKYLPAMLAKTPLAASPFVERRREARYATCEAVEVCILDVESQPQRGILRDVSRSGLRIELSLPLGAGAHLEVVLVDRAIIFGEARYCRRSAHAYQVGVVIEDIYYPKSGPAGHAADSAETLRPARRDLPQTVFSRRQFLRRPIALELTGSHASPDDVAAFLHHDLSETKTALMERHLTVCEECSNLMRMMLEDHTSFVAIFGNDTT
jgi:PilZ domain